MDIIGNSASSLQQSAYWSTVDQVAMEQGQRDLAKSAIAANAAICEQFDAAVLTVHQDKELTSHGKTTRIVALADKATKAIVAAAKPALAALAEQIAGHAAALKTAAAGPDSSAVLELRAQEVRREFAKHDPLDRPFEYNRLNDAGRHDAARAIEDAPGAPLLDAKTIAQGIANRGGRTLPERAMAKNAAVAVQDQLEKSVDYAKRHLAVTATVDGRQVIPDAITLAARGNGA